MREVILRAGDSGKTLITFSEESLRNIAEQNPDLLAYDEEQKVLLYEGAFPFTIKSVGEYSHTFMGPLK